MPGVRVPCAVRPLVFPVCGAARQSYAAAPHTKGPLFFPPPQEEQRPLCVVPSKERKKRSCGRRGTSGGGTRAFHL